MAILISQLAADLQSKLPDWASKIWRAKKSSVSIDQRFGVIDFFSFIDKLRIETGADWNRTLFERITDYRQKLITASLIVPGPSVSLFQPTAFSFFFPDDADAINETVETFFVDSSPLATLFTRVSRWNDFVIAFVKQYPPPLDTQQE